MRKLRELEDVLIRVESALAVVLVLTMLLLAAYNVVYRNVLVPLQNHWAHSGPPVQPASVEPVPVQAEAAADAKGTADAKADAKADAAKEGADDFGGFGGLGEDDPGQDEAKAGADDFGGFGGALGEEDEGAPEAKAAADAKAVPEAKAEPAKSAADDFGGFGGGLDEEAPEQPPPAKAPVEVAKAEPAKPPVKSSSDDFGGFGGGLGEDEPEPEPANAPDAKAEKAGADDFGGFGGLDEGGEAKADGEVKAEAGADASDAKAPAADELEDEEDELGEDDLGDDDQFANLPDIDAVAKQPSDASPQGGPPPEGSFAAWAVAFIDDIKLDWIDVFLRQLVIIVAFFGAMLATQRGKHINVDALGKVLPRSVQRVVGVLLPLAAVSVCLVLAKAGWDLVQISREYPKDLLPSVPEWTLQLMFPVGFGLLAVHFAVRIVEAAVAPPDPDPQLRNATTTPVVAADDVDADPTDEVGDDLLEDRGDAPRKKEVR